jgi:3-hydroxybutyryl-CoA dehydrogenase
LHDRSKDQVAKGLALVDKLLAKDVGKGRLTGLQAKETRERISVVDSLEGMRDVDMVVEVRVLCFYVFVQTVIGAI